MEQSYSFQEKVDDTIRGFTIGFQIDAILRAIEINYAYYHIELPADGVLSVSIYPLDKDIFTEEEVRNLCRAIMKYFPVQGKKKYRRHETTFHWIFSMLMAKEGYRVFFFIENVEARNCKIEEIEETEKIVKRYKITCQDKK